ncbi:MAG: NYN domain-containing protein [Gammaproteobacteria bacterium]|nr:NYN domain-containing protein [Gammaproteobacteria bacterium]MCB1922939.1 NYN domain-containing protein [Gammaproteobacteria bacterium]
MNSHTTLLAVLIDADNTSPKYAKAIFEEISGFGEASVRRCYGDFSSSRMSGWSERIASFGLVPHHQPANTVGKNASDIALVIDAMDLLHSGRFDGFVLVSSDSDFTRLASRIREQGLDVYGIGEKKTPDAFRQACKRFIFVENLGDDDSAATEPLKPVDRTALNRAYQLIRNVMETSPDPDGWTAPGWIGQQLVQRYPDFDQRSFGFTKLTELIRATAKFEEMGSGGGLRFRLPPA